MEEIVMTVDTSSTSRRTLLRRVGAIGATAGSASLTGCISIFFGSSRESFSGNPISFSTERKRIRKKDADIIVHNRSELLSAIKKPGAVIWIPEKVTINMGRGPTAGSNSIEPNVTIASNRHLRKKNNKGKGHKKGKKKSNKKDKGKGGLIKTDGYIQKIFTAKGPCRVTGIRFQGPEKKYFNPPHSLIYSYAASCFHFTGKTAIVDNCEAYGWTAMAIALGTKDTPTQGWIHHNEMHHNQMNHLGYPMELYNGIHLIEWNYFSKYRHAITGYGHPTNGYEARFNVVGPPGGSPYAFAFDMHSLGEQDNYPIRNTTAGKYLNVHHNVFEVTKHNAMSISGIPTKYARFCNNWCATSKDGNGKGVPAVSAPDNAKVRKKNNQFKDGAVRKGRQQLMKLAASIPLSNGKPSLSAWSRPQKHSTKSKKNKESSTPTQSSPEQRSTTEGN